MTYGLKEYKELLERNLMELKDPNTVPFGMDPHSGQAADYRRNKSESINYALEMLPEIKEPMKDHEFREEVNDLYRLVKVYANTQQLRSNLSGFLREFKEKCNY